MTRIKKIGLIVNPVAGIGGTVGLKGSDGIDIQAKALELGAVKKSNMRAKVALKELLTYKDTIEIVTYPKEMGENISKELGFKTKVIGEIEDKKTTGEDTEEAAKKMLEEKVDIILFAGGDGTARNIYSAVKGKILVLGIPAGVKIHSAVYALNPQSAGKLIKLFLDGETVEIQEAEVMDIDEDAFREGRVTARLYGYLNVPYEKRYVQNMKSGGVAGEKAVLEGIANHVISNMEEDSLYIIGPGTTTRDIMEKLNLKHTLLGIDLIYNKEIIKYDANEKDILKTLDKYKKAKIIVTTIGGQGYIFGRGNQQISSEVIKKVKKENINIVTTEDKLNQNFMAPLVVDTGDLEVDEYLKGYYKIIIGYENMIMYKVG